MASHLLLATLCNHSANIPRLRKKQRTSLIENVPTRVSVLKPESTETEDDLPDIVMLTADIALLRVSLPPQP